jgi:hypothetical protein
VLQSAAFGAFGPLPGFQSQLAGQFKAIPLIFKKENLLDNFQ